MTGRGPEPRCQAAGLGLPVSVPGADDDRNDDQRSCGDETKTELTRRHVLVCLPDRPSGRHGRLREADTGQGRNAIPRNGLASVLEKITDELHD